MKIKLLAFDVDGTLFTSEAILHRAYTEAISDYNSSSGSKLKTPELNEILSQIGNPGRKIFRNLFPDMDSRDYAQLGCLVRERLIFDINEGNGTLYSNVYETIEHFHKVGFSLRIASNGGKDYVEAVVKYYGIEKFFGPLVSLDGEGIKDKGDILNTYKSVTGIRSYEMVMIGDRKSDLLAARKAGCPFIGFTGGHGSYDEIKEIDSILFDDFSKLPDIIKVLQQDPTNN
ncbi:MAG: HAD family hydrolase [Fibrobacteres bacterium]|nr:HAD family hydrolase [Fibrobacterota bacterium]